MNGKFFTELELACRCGCGENLCTPELVNLLDAIRLDVGRPLKISRAYSCAAHNKALKASPRHPTGNAADILCSGQIAFSVVNSARENGAVGIGVAQNPARPAANRFVHVDLLGAYVGTTWSRRGIVWSYD